ncbi:MAG: TonB-dependent receptor [Bacteroidales bacterium]|nr:TonB-dependent receptor [Bacteroidales bacterium]
MNKWFFKKIKTFKIMRITVFIMLAFILQIFTSDAYSQINRISFDCSQNKSADVFDEIEDISEFFYNEKLINTDSKITLSRDNKKIDEISNTLFSETNMGCTITDSENILSPKFLSDGQQQDSVSGIITNKSGEFLPGVTVLIKGTFNGTTTNKDGHYSISNISDSTTLQFSFVGMRTQEVLVGNQTTINIIMIADAIGLDEVVVIGYGSQSRKDVTGAITTLTTDDIKSMAATGIDKSIQGKAAGVLVTNNTGEPGGGVTIRIRGTTSISSGNDPLYVIDGVPLVNTQTSNRNVGESRINGMSQINPFDIESIEILKDAAATSIFGARGANGVILVKTKRGKIGKGELTVDLYLGMSELANRYDLLGASDYAILVNEGRAQLANIEPEYYPYFSQSFINNPTVNTNWQDEIFRIGKVEEVNVSFVGGTETTKYMISSGFYNQKGIIIGSDFNRFNIRANVDQKLGERFSLGTNLYASVIDQRRIKNDGSPDNADASNFNHIYGGPVLSTALVKAPTTPVYLADGTFSNDVAQIEYGNPVRQAIDVNIKNNVNRIIASAYAKVDLLPRINFRVQVSGDIRNELEKWFNPPNPNAFDGTDWRGQASQRNFNQRVWTLENYFTYKLGINNHSFTFLAGNTLQETMWESSFILVSGIVSDKIQTLNAGTDIDVAISDKQAYGINSYFGRIDYNYKGKYLLLLNARYDGSSRFGKKHRYGFFPSASVGWRISDEPFLEPANFLTNWKLRVSYGITGNQEISNYASRGIMSIGTGTNIGGNYTDETGAVISSLPSPNLKWEETTQFNVGTDVSLFKSRVNFTVDYYIKTTNDLIFLVPIPSTMGMSHKWENIGKMENRGIEFSVNGTIIAKNKFNWNADFIISRNANKVLELMKDQDVIVSGAGGSSIARVGEPISFYLYEREEFVNPEDGTVVIIDQDGSGDLPNEGDRIIAGSPFPDFYGGFTNTMSYKNFDLSIFFQYSYGNKIYNATRSWIETLKLNDRTIIGTNTTQAAFDNRWQEPGDITKYPVVNYDGRDNQYTLPNTGWLEDGSYLRLKTLTLGYNFAPNVISKLRLKSARIYITAVNLLTFTNYSGYDPEVDHFTGVNGGPNSGLLRGYDYGSYPQSRSYIIGIKISF